MNAFALAVWIASATALVAGPEAEAEAEVSAPAPELPEALVVAEGGEYLISAGAEPLEAGGEEPLAKVEFRAGAMVMTRGETIRSRGVDGVGVSSSSLPVRLRAQVEARAGRARVLAQLQDARVIQEGSQPTLTGFHQLLFEHRTHTRRGEFEFRAGRQEYELGSNHLLGIALWAPGMRSWDGARVSFEGPRGGVGAFVGSLARPLLSAPLPLVDHVSSTVVLIGALTAQYRVAKALEVSGFVVQEHRKMGGEVRNLNTAELRLAGQPVPGLRYEAEGDFQVGMIERLDLRQLHVAGHAYALLDYLTPEGLGPEGRVSVGGFAAFDFASGSRCTTTAYTGLSPCTEGTNHDFDATWMRRHVWFGHADRFWAQNVIDGSGAVHVLARLADELTLDLTAVEHVLALAEPDGRWHDTSGARVGVDLANRDRLMANEVDVEARLRYKIWSLNLGWIVVTNFAAGRSLSSEAMRQFAYVQLQVNFWSSWR